MWFWCNGFDYVIAEFVKVAFEHPFTHRERALFSPSQLESSRTVPMIEDEGVIHFGPIVVVAGNPEDRDYQGPELILQVPGEGDGSQGLVNGVKRSGKEPRLLPGGDHRPAITNETIEALAGGI
jgi:hypothetical protein